MDNHSARYHSELTPREAHVMGLAASGMKNREIAQACRVAEKTVKNHLNSIFSKLCVRTRAEATEVWLARPERGEKTDRNLTKALYFDGTGMVARPDC